MRARPLVLLLALCWGRATNAQSTTLTRRDAIRTALATGPRSTVARIDTVAARAMLIGAGVFPNPVASLSYSKSAPKFHALVELPFDYRQVRQTRIDVANAGLRAAAFRVEASEALIALDADTTYTRALAAQARLALSARNVRDADSLRHLAEIRRDAGDVSDLEVKSAAAFAGQQARAVLGDSLVLTSALLDLQAVLGFATDRPSITLADTLALPDSVLRTPPVTLPVAAATAAVDAADVAMKLQRHSIWSMPALTFGFDYLDHDAPGLLPTVGLAFGFPFFDKNRGGIAMAEAERSRARAELALAESESRSAILRAQRMLSNALARVARDRTLVANANELAALAVTAYREGAYALANVLEAQRMVRDAEGDLIDDVAAAAVAAATLRFLSQSPVGLDPR